MHASAHTRRRVYWEAVEADSAVECVPWCPPGRDVGKRKFDPKTLPGSARPGMEWSVVGPNTSDAVYERAFVPSRDGKRPCAVMQIEVTRVG